MTRNALALVLAAAAFTSCSRQPPIRIGGLTGTEGTLLCEIASLHVEKRLGRPVERKLNLGDSLQAHQNILTGVVDAYPEYVAPALASILQVDLGTEATAAVERARQEYERRFQLKWLPPVGFDRRVVMVVRASDAQRLKLATLSDVEKWRGGWGLVARRDFTSSRWGLPLLTKNYRFEFSRPALLAGSQEIYQALRQGRATLAAGYATDAAISNPEFLPLKDDRNAFVPNPASFVLRTDRDEAVPGLRKALEELSGKIDTGKMLALNREMDERRRFAADVAAEFLAAAGFR